MEKNSRKLPSFLNDEKVTFMTQSKGILFLIKYIFYSYFKRNDIITTFKLYVYKFI